MATHRWRAGVPGVLPLSSKERTFCWAVISEVCSCAGSGGSVAFMMDSWRTIWARLSGQRQHVRAPLGLTQWRMPGALPPYGTAWRVYTCACMHDYVAVFVGTPLQLTKPEPDQGPKLHAVAD